MANQTFLHPDEIRTLFSTAMSRMYRSEVPQYGTLMELVADVNEVTLAEDGALRETLTRHDELARLSLERHGAIRLSGTRPQLRCGADGMRSSVHLLLDLAGARPEHILALRAGQRRR